MFGTAKTYKQLAAPVPHQGGYLGSVNVVPADAHDLMGVEYLTDACAPGQVWAELCYNANQNFCSGDAVTEPTDGYKVFGQPELVEGEPFAVYEGAECDGLITEQEAMERAAARLGYAESRQVDYAIDTWLAANVDQDLGSGTLKALIMRFEDFASASYGGYPVVSMRRSLVTRAVAERLVFPSPNGGFQTALGALVVPTAEAAASYGDDTDIYVTGQITLVQGQVIQKMVSEVVRPDGSCDPARGLAERMYVPLVECMVASATVTSE